jgi:hypothetical protein
MFDIVFPVSPTEQPDEQFVWVLDSLVGHLAVNHREGELAKYMERPTIHFRSPNEALPALHEYGLPEAILVGYVVMEELEDLLQHPGLESVKVLLTDTHRPMRKWPSGKEFSQNIVQWPGHLYPGDAVREFARSLKS